MTLTERIDRSLTNHTPSPKQVEGIEAIRQFAKDLGHEIAVGQPGSREQSLAVTALEEAVMWAVKGIILNGIGDPPRAR